VPHAEQRSESGAGEEFKDGHDDRVACPAILAEVVTRA
jgi:hypothetical protein